MTAQSLNLLRYPRRVPALDAALWRPAAAALLTGALAGGVWGGWQHMRQDGLLALHARLQEQVQTLSGQQAGVTARQAKARLHQAFLDRAQAWQSQRERVMRLHAGLTEQARDTGLRVERWQADGRRLFLQAWLPGAEQVPRAVAALSAAWPQGWTLQSLSERIRPQGEAGVDVVFEAPRGEVLPGGGKAQP